MALLVPLVLAPGSVLSFVRGVSCGHHEAPALRSLSSCLIHGEGRAQRSGSLVVVVDRRRIGTRVSCPVHALTFLPRWFLSNPRIEALFPCS